MSKQGYIVDIMDSGERERFAWALRARAKDESKAILTAILIEPAPVGSDGEAHEGWKRVVCVDGKRLHIALFNEEQAKQFLPPDGVWTVAKVEGKRWVLCEYEGGNNFPNYNALIPADYPTLPCVTLGDFKTKFDVNVYRIITEGEVMISIEYLADFKTGGWMCFCDAPHKVVMASNDGDLALIMGMHV